MCNIWTVRKNVFGVFFWSNKYESFRCVRFWRCISMKMFFEPAVQFSIRWSLFSLRWLACKFTSFLRIPRLTKILSSAFQWHFAQYGYWFGRWKLYFYIAWRNSCSQEARIVFASQIGNIFFFTWYDDNLHYSLLFVIFISIIDDLQVVLNEMYPADTRKQKIFIILF